MADTETKILLVEDNDLDVIMVQRLLKRMSLDYPIVRAANGEEALAMLRPAHGERTLVPPFVMLVDINMPRMNGFELLDELADDEFLSQVPVYIMSTSNNPNDKTKAGQYSIRGYLVKPVTESILADVLELPAD